MTDLQKKTAQAIVNIFETSRVRGEYGRVTVIPGDNGHLTYGRSQTTLASGNLHLLIKAYCEAPDASLAGRLRRYLVKLAACDVSLDRDMRLRALLEEAGQDVVMREVQDAFFDRVYWERPCTLRCSRLQAQSGVPGRGTWRRAARGRAPPNAGRGRRPHYLVRPIGGTSAAHLRRRSPRACSRWRRRASAASPPSSGCTVYPVIANPEPAMSSSRRSGSVSSNSRRHSG
jgi:hypothetical protein